MKIKAPCSARTNYRRLAPFLRAVDATEEQYITFRSGEYMPLSVENLGYTWEGLPVYAMMHYYTQHGDLMRDPDVTFAVDHANGTVIPLAFQQDGLPWGSLYQHVFESNGREYRPRLLAELDRFLRQWSTNIVDQGFNPSSP